MLGKQAADAGYAERMARVRALSSVNPALQISQAAAEGAGQGFGNVANTYSFGLTDRLGLTHTKGYVNDAANKWSKGLALTSAVAMPVGGALRGGALALRAARGSRVAAAIGRALQARKATTVARAAVPAARTGSAVGDWARFLSMAPVPRPMASLSYALKTPEYLRQAGVYATPAVKWTAQQLARIPGVRGAVQRLVATRGAQAVGRAGQLTSKGYHGLINTRPMRALSRASTFVEGGGGRASKAFMVADAAVPMYAGIRDFDPQSEAMARALGYDSQFVADVSTTPGSFVPAARIQPPLYNTVPGMVNERRMRKWVDQYGRDVQALTDAQTAASKDLLSRRY